MRPSRCLTSGLDIGAARAGSVGVTVRIMEAVYRLRQLVDRMAHVAEVAVRIETASQDEVAVSADAFAWRRDVYGPDAVDTGPGDQLLIAEAMEGVHYVLRSLSARGGYRVMVMRIWETPVDTWPGDVKVAAARAVCEALGVQLEPAPGIGATGAELPE